LIRSFVSMREQYLKLVALRIRLAEEIDSSFCIMGPAFSADGGMSIPESSALFANALFTGRCITPAQSRYILLWSLTAAFGVLFCLYALRPFLLWVLGFALTLLCGAAFGVYFIFSGYWIDPYISMAACFGGTLFLTVSRFCIGYGRAMRFRFAYSGSVNKAMLKVLLRAGRPRLSEILCVPAVIIAVKSPGLSGREDRGRPLEAVKIAAEFREAFSRVFRQAGAMVLGFEADTALACFGSPPERFCQKKIRLKNMRNPVAKAELCITELLSDPMFLKANSPFADWRFGIESGDCAFSWNKETGCVVNGRPVVRARIFASLANRYNARVVIGEMARNDADLLTRRLSSLGNSSRGQTGESFYELIIR
jgi:hypothetical protein